MRNILKINKHFISLNIRSMKEYKTSFLLTTLGKFLVSFNVFLGIYFMFQRFSSVNEFSYEEVLLCFSIVLLEFSLAEMFARGFDIFSDMVRKGSFDLILIRLQNEIFQVLGSKFELTRVGRMIQAVVMFIYAVVYCHVQWNALKILTVVFMLIGGMAVFSGLFWYMRLFAFSHLRVLNL